MNNIQIKDGGTCEHSNELLGSIKWGEFCD